MDFIASGHDQTVYLCWYSDSSKTFYVDGVGNNNKITLNIYEITFNRNRHDVSTAGHQSQAQPYEIKGT